MAGVQQQEENKAGVASLAGNFRRCWNDFSPLDDAKSSEVQPAHNIIGGMVVSWLRERSVVQSFRGQLAENCCQFSASFS